MAAQLTINNITDILCVGATELGVLSTLVMAEFWPNKRFVITDTQQAINKWRIPANLTEPELDRLLLDRTAAPPNGNVVFQPMDIKLQVNNCQMVVVATDVKTKARGIGANKKLNLASWDHAMREVLTHATQLKVIVMKSALPHDVNLALNNVVGDVSVVNPIASTFSILWVPEFFSPGTALHDLRHPSRVVISLGRGHTVVDDNATMDVVADFYRLAPNWVDNDNILLYRNHASAAIGVIGSNVMLACQAILMQVMTEFCESITQPANAEDVREIITSDPRIGNQFLDGVDRSAQLRDLKYFKHLAELTDDRPAYQLLSSVIRIAERNDM